MDRYFIGVDEEDGYLVEVKFTDGTEATVRGFSSEEDAEHWVEERWRERSHQPRHQLGDGAQSGGKP